MKVHFTHHQIHCLYVTFPAQAKAAKTVFFCVCGKMYRPLNHVSCVIQALYFYGGWKPFLILLKCTLVQALRLCTGRTAHRGSRGIALPFHDHDTIRGDGSASRPGRSLPPGNIRYPLYRRLGGPQGRPGQVRKISSPTGFDPRTVQPVASRYTDYASRPTFETCILYNSGYITGPKCVWSLKHLPHCERLHISCDSCSEKDRFLKYL